MVVDCPQIVQHIPNTNAQLILFLAAFECTAPTKEKLRQYLQSKGFTNLNQLDGRDAWNYLQYGTPNIQAKCHSNHVYNNCWYTANNTNHQCQSKRSGNLCLGN